LHFDPFRAREQEVAAREEGQYRDGAVVAGQGVKRAALQGLDQ
jgi:hypothetical protein